MNQAHSELEELYKQSIKIIREGSIITGKIVSIKPKDVLVDVGFKSEGVVPIEEFKKDELEVGKELEFFVESIENDAGVLVLSRERAMRIQGWDKIVKQFQEQVLIAGKPIKKVKGGYLVDVMGVEGFLPASLSMFKGVPEKDILYKYCVSISMTFALFHLYYFLKAS